MTGDRKSSRPSSRPQGSVALSELDQERSREGVDVSGTVASGQSEHALLMAGKIDVAEFMDMAVDRALAHVENDLSPARLSAMREVLRAQLEQDPYIAELVERATAAAGA